MGGVPWPLVWDYYASLRQSPSCLGFPAAQETAKGWLGGAMLGQSASATGGWLATLAWLFSLMRSRDSKSLSLASNAANRLYLLHVPLSLKEAEE